MAESKKEDVSPLARQSATHEQSHLNKDGYVGVDPIYQNAANKTDEPAKEKSSNGTSGRGAEKSAPSSK